MVNTNRSTRTSGLAVASLVMGCLGWILLLPALFGLVFGIVALVQISKSDGRLRGQGVATAGLVLSSVMVLLTPILLAILFPVFARAHQKALQISCLSNTKHLVMGMHYYMADWDDVTPPAGDPPATLPGLLQPYVMGDWSVLTVCNADRDGLPSYGLDARYAGRSMLGLLTPAPKGWGLDPAATPWLWESDGPLAESVPPIAWRHLDGANIGYLDGHAKWQPRLGVDSYSPNASAH